ncbi:uncharacterized protein KY384_004253 [Bacidia gigantensis]|uniref:uncharacterized protein n=1 Tax=Bacidia gigantensis TaxID=2732470 RepID=UPI001D05959C|nr:uncharacterized protein KY384_004253 [Bacidia gigantensis]KAG8530896.1 hypothetical protein KY384_004253 [Bacidia gigantensis]
MVNIVSVSGKKYQVDVGFGLNGPTQPILLEEGWETTSISPSGVRLVRDFIPDFRDKNEDQDKLWIFQHRAAPSEGWQPIYAFTEIEFIPQDYEISNFFTSTSRTSFFTSAIVVVKYLLDNLGKGQLIGSMSLMNGFAKRRMRGNTKLLTECKTEEERIRALRDYFGIEIKEDEKQGIKGLVTELKGK